MSISIHAKKLASISRTAFTNLNICKTRFEEYLYRTSSLWNIAAKDVLEAFIQIFIYLSYNLYLKSEFQKNFALEKNEKRFPVQYRNFFLVHEDIPPEIRRFLVIPLKIEIKTWDRPKKKEISMRSQFFGIYLQYYKPKKAKESGIVYTPKEIVDFMIHGIHILLIHLFGIKNGLKNPKFPYKIVDPAAGTLNFIVGLIKFIYTPDSGIMDLDHKLMALELNEISFLIGSYELSSLIPLSNKIPHLHKRNTLTEESYDLINDFLNANGSDHLSIILGNPPYYINTQNNLPWIRNEIREYKENLHEKNLKILSDDYVKFIRISQKLFQDKNRIGIIAFITNNNYLDGSVFKSMRKSLLKTFDQIYVVNLHGNLRKGETGNPFKIKIGVSIVFMVRKGCNIKHDSILGGENDPLNISTQVYCWDLKADTLTSKYQILNQGFNLERFKKIPLSTNYFFTPRNLEIDMRFDKFVPINDIFISKPKSGVMSGRDALVSNPDEEIIKENLTLFFRREFETLKKLNIIVKKTKTWDPNIALKRTSEKTALGSIIRYNYRGFIKDFLVYDNSLVDGCRLGYLDIINLDNPAICTTRSVRSLHFSHALVVDAPPEKCLLGIKDSCYVFPLHKPENLNEYNLKPPEVGFETSPRDIFYYIYAILYSTTYRTRYEMPLKRHFPHIPFPYNNLKLFEQMSTLGQDLVKAHLTNKGLPIAEIEIHNPEKPLIRNFYYNEHKNTIVFDSMEHSLTISGISPQMWRFEIGSIPQIEYWLKSRQFKTVAKKRHIGLTRSLTESELNEFIVLCARIKRTIEILPKIDSVYDKIDVL